MTRFILAAVASVCLLLTGCSRHVLRASSGYIKVSCSFDHFSNAVGVTASRAGAQNYKIKEKGNNAGIQQGEYSYTTSEGVIVEIVYYKKRGSAIRVNVSVIPESESVLSKITEDLFNNITKDL